MTAAPDMSSVHAADHPDKMAVIDDRGSGIVRTVTYRQLEARVNQLAHVLREHGLGPGDKVIWCGQNSMGIVDRFGQGLEARTASALLGRPRRQRVTVDDTVCLVRLPPSRSDEPGVQNAVSRVTVTG